MSRNIRSRLKKLEQTSPARGDKFTLTLYYRPGELDRLQLAGYEQLAASGYHPEHHQLKVFCIPDNGRPHPGRPRESITIARYK